MDSKKRDKIKNSLNTTQTVLYGNEFRKADRASGLNMKKGRR